MPHMHLTTLHVHIPQVYQRLRFCPVRGTWTTLASLSKPRGCHASAVVRGKLYVFGGYRVEVEVYSPASNCWARAADLPSAIGEFVAIAL